MSDANFDISPEEWQEFQALMQTLESAETDDFLELAKILGRDPRRDLRGADLRGINLRGANLSGADLSGADLSDANLSDVRLIAANLSDANLSRTNLNSADLSGADLSGADLSSVYLRSVYFNADGSTRNIYIRSVGHRDTAEGSIFKRRLPDLSGANLRYAFAICADLSGANLSGANLHGADLRFVYLQGTDLSDADLSDADLSDADLSGAILSGTNLRRAIVRQCRFGAGIGLSKVERMVLQEQGAIFDDASGDRGSVETHTPSPR